MNRIVLKDNRAIFEIPSKLKSINSNENVHLYMDHKSIFSIVFRVVMQWRFSCNDSMVTGVTLNYQEAWVQQFMRSVWSACRFILYTKTSLFSSLCSVSEAALVQH